MSHYLNVKTKEIIIGSERKNDGTIYIGPYTYRYCIEVRDRVLTLENCIEKLNVGNRDSLSDLMESARKIKSILRDDNEGSDEQKTEKNN